VRRLGSRDAARLHRCRTRKYSRQALTILSLERYQVLGGPTYDAGWVRSDKVMLASANPVILDFVGQSNSEILGI
jgi:hypothetical protein